MAKSWQEKFASGGEPEVIVVDKEFAGIPVGTKMLIATPKVIHNYVQQIPVGKEVDWQTLRKDLAIQFEAETTCPTTTSIFLRIAAEVAIEKYSKGTPLDQVMPFWRVIHPKLPIAKRLSCGVSFIKEQRRKENLS